MVSGKPHLTGRWQLAIAGLPTLAVVILVAFRARTENWADAAVLLVTSPFSLVALVIFVDYAVRRNSGTRTVKGALWWLVSGAALLIGSLGVELVPISWIEAVLDGALVVVGAACLADGFCGLAENLRSKESPRRR